MGAVEQLERRVLSVLTKSLGWGGVCQITFQLCLSMWVKFQIILSEKSCFKFHKQDNKEVLKPFFSFLFILFFSYNSFLFIIFSPFFVCQFVHFCLDFLSLLFFLLLTLSSAQIFRNIPPLVCEILFFLKNERCSETYRLNVLCICNQRLLFALSKKMSPSILK